MLHGDRLRLRTVREGDLDDLHTKLSTLGFRGRHFPSGLQSQPTFRRKFDEDGFWGSDDGMLLMVDAGDVVVGEIEYYPITHYLVGYELSYLVFGTEHRGRGYATEAGAASPRRRASRSRG
jgi:RimJ/RimL family protein N-acetyltransferase